MNDGSARLLCRNIGQADNTSPGSSKVLFTVLTIITSDFISSLKYFKC